MPDVPQAPRIREQFVTDTIPVGFPWRLFTFSLALFVFSLFVFFGLKFGYAAYINERAEDLDRKINDLARQISQEDQQSFVSFYSQVINLEKVLNRHEFTANIFSFLEKNTLSEIYYTEAEFSSVQNSLNLTGIAASNEALVGELSLLDGREEVARANLNQMNVERTGGVAFDITIFFKDEFFQKPTL